MASLIADLLDRLDVERRYLFEERAGNIEYGSGLVRDEAEVLALVDLLRADPAALLGVTAFELDGRPVITTDIEAARDRSPGLVVIDLAELIRDRFNGTALIHQLGDHTNDN